MARHPAESVGAAGEMAEQQTIPEANILDAFEGPVERVRVTPMYRLATVLVAAVMVLLPLIYVSIIVLVGYLLRLHILNAPAVFMWPVGVLPRMIVVVAPLVIGGTLILFMIKPLFARSATESSPVQIEPADEPALYAFVGKICGVIGAPRPRTIYVDCEINAAAGFRGGLSSFLTGDLALVVGLPLIEGLDTRQFAGVLAHEFGHFAQGVGMRLTYVVHSINRWFGRVVYERDRWDRSLEEWADSGSMILSLTLHLARGFVWASRKVLWLLMTVGHGVSCLLLRQREFNADQYQIRVSGSQTFESTLARLRLLEVARLDSLRMLEDAWEAGRAAEDLPALVCERAGRIPADEAQRLERSGREAKTGWFDTHPSDRQRIDRVRREVTAGVFGLQLPASTLFHGLDSLSRRATERFYLEALGSDFDRDFVVPNAALIEREASSEACWESLLRYFPAGLLVAHPPWFSTSTDGEQTNDEEMIGRLNRQRDELIQVAPTAKQVIDAIASDNDREGLLEESRDVMDRYLRAASERLSAALRLLDHPRVVEQLGDDDLRSAEIDGWTTALATMEQGSGITNRLRENLSALDSMRSAEGEVSDGEVQLLLGELWKDLFELHRTLDGPFPFQSRHDGLSIAAYVVGPGVAARGESYEQAHGAVGRFDQLTFRILASLTRIGEQVESALGLEPLPEIEGSDSDPTDSPTETTGP